MTAVNAGGRDIEVSNPDKVLFPGDGITKGSLVDYYAAVAPVMLPHVRGRPVMMQRFPDGIGRAGFMQKQASPNTPAWVGTVEVAKRGGSVRHVTIEDPATLVWLADQACITPHVWLSRADRVDRPDRLVFDLDPWEEDAAAVRAAAGATRTLLDELGLTSFVMSTGSRGLHVVVCLDRSAGFEEVLQFARDAAAVLVARHPDTLTAHTSRDKRGGRLYLDVLRNRWAQTTVAPYAVRPLPHAPVAMPLPWDEAESRRFDPRRYTLRSALQRVEREGDAWADMERHAHSLRAARARLAGLRPTQSAPRPARRTHRP